VAQTVAKNSTDTPGIANHLTVIIRNLPVTCLLASFQYFSKPSTCCLFLLLFCFLPTAQQLFQVARNSEPVRVVSHVLIIAKTRRRPDEIGLAGKRAAAQHALAASAR
jgi:hypothetical protein